MVKWTTVEKLAADTGLTREAIWAYKKKGYLKQGIHWTKRGRRMFINRENFDKWLEGTEA